MLPILRNLYLSYTAALALSFAQKLGVCVQQDTNGALKKLSSLASLKNHNAICRTPIEK